MFRNINIWTHVHAIFSSGCVSPSGHLTYLPDIVLSLQQTNLQLLCACLVPATTFNAYLVRVLLSSIITGNAGIQSTQGCFNCVTSCYKAFFTRYHDSNIFVMQGKDAAAAAALHGLEADLSASQHASASHQSHAQGMWPSWHCLSPPCSVSS